MKNLFCLFVLFFTLFALQAQHKCGNEVHPQTVENDFQYRLKFKQQQAKSSNSLQTASFSSIYSNPNVVFDVVVHIPFTYTLSQSQVYTSFCSLNQKFAPLGIQFRVSEFRYDGSGISNLSSGNVDGSDNLLTPFDVAGKINLYFPATMFDDGAASFPFDKTTPSGFTQYKSSRIIVRSNRLTVGNGSTFTHEFGHFLGLYHTYQTNNYVGTDCTQAYDQVCDTPYDPISRTSCYFDSNCSWVNAGGCVPSAPFPLGNNFMTSTVDQFANEWTTCRNFFTQGQYARMLDSYNVYASSFFNQFTRTSLPFSISGGDIVCSAGTTYSIPAQSNATSYSWRLLQDNGTSLSVLTTGGNATSFTPSVVTNFSGFVEVRVNYADGSCLYATKKVSGLPSSSISVSGQGMTVCTSGLSLALIYNGSNLSSSNPPLPFGILEVEWAPTSGNVYVVRNQANGGVTATAYANSPTGVSAQLRVRVRNCAGWSNWYFFNVNICSSGFRFAYSPNPTSDKLDITAVPTDDNKDFKIATSIDFEVKLIDGNGKTVREAKNLNKETKLTLDVKDLKEGVYFLHIAHGKEIEKYQIVVGKPAN